MANREKTVADYNRSRDAISTVLVELMDSGVDIIPALLAMHQTYLDVVMANFPHEIAKEFVSDMAKEVEKRSLKQVDALPVC